MFSSGSLQPSRTPPEILTPVRLSPAKCDAGLFVWPTERIPIYQFYVRVKMNSFIIQFKGELRRQGERLNQSRRETSSYEFGGDTL